MKTTLRKVPLLPAAMGLMVAVSTVPLSWADEHDEVPFPVGRLFFQLNDTDEDLGIHLLVDGEPWKKLEIDDPKDRRLFYVLTQSRLRRQGLTEFKFESAEPSFDEFSAEQFFRRFPEGEYDIEAHRLDGGEYETTAVISHVLPAPPDGLQVNGEDTLEDCDEGPFLEVGEPITISWDPVMSSHPDIGTPGLDVNVLRYEVAVERDEPFLKLEANVHVEGSPITEFQVPAGLLSPGDLIKFQVLVEIARGNETSSESCFLVN